MPDPFEIAMARYVSKGVQRGAEDGRIGIGLRAPESGFEKLIDVIARTEYASAGVARALIAGEPGDVLPAIGRGITARDRITYFDIAADELGLTTEPLFAVPDWKYVPTLIEGMIRAASSPAGITGLALGMALDPLAWTSFGELTKLGQFGRLLKGGVTAKDLAKGGKMARRFEQAIARNGGRAPTPLAITAAEQAQRGQRALIQLATPWGSPILTLVKGEKVFQAATGMARILRTTPQVSAVMRLFSHFGIPGDVMDRWAVARAAERYEVEAIQIRLLELGKLLTSDDGNMVRRALETERLTKEVIRRLVRRVPIAASAQNTAELVHHILKKTDADRTAVESVFVTQFKKDLGLGVNDDLTDIIQIGADSIIRQGAFSFSEGKETLASLIQREAFAGIDITSPLPFNTAGTGAAGVTRMTVTRGTHTPLAGSPTGHANARPIKSDQWRVTFFDENNRVMGQVSADGIDALIDETVRPALRGTNLEGTDAQLIAWNERTVERMGRRKDDLDQIGVLQEQLAIHAANFEEKVLASMNGEMSSSIGTTFQVIQDFTDDLHAAFGGPIVLPQLRDKAGKIRPTREGDNSVYFALADTYRNFVKWMNENRHHTGMKRQVLPQQRDFVRTGKTERTAAGRVRVGEYNLDEIAANMERWTKGEGEAGLATAAEEMISMMEATMETNYRAGAVRAIEAVGDNDASMMGLINNLLVRLDQDMPVRSKLHVPERSAPVRPREIPVNSAEVRTSMAETIEVHRFSNLPDRLRMVAVELEGVFNDIWEREAAMGLQHSRRPAYFPHIRYEDLGKIKWLAKLGRKKEMVLPRNPFERARTMEGTIDEINKRMGREFLVEDLLTASFIRAQASSRMVNYHDFVNVVLSRHGLSESLDANGRLIPGEIKDVQRAFEYVEVNPEYGIYFPRGKQQFYEAVGVPEKIQRQAIKENLARMAREKTGAKVKPKDVDVSAARREAAKSAGMEAGEASSLDTLRWLQSGARGGEILLEAKVDDLRTMLALGKKPTAYILPKEVADFMNRANHFNNTPEGLVQLGNFIREVRKIWVPWTLFIFPAYHTRNAVGNVLNALYAGLNNPVRYADAFWLQRNGLRKKGKAGSRSWKSVRDEVITDDQIIKEMYQHGVVDTGWTYTEFDEIRIHKVQNELKRKGVKKVVAALSPDPRDNMFINAGFRIGSWVENNAKIALFLDRRLKGDNAALAARAVRKYVFDYDEITGTERWLKTFFVPFYTWFRKNMSLQVEQLLRRPNTFSTLRRAAQLLEAAAGDAEDGEILPTWMRESFPIRLGKDEKNVGRYEYFVMRNWLPAVELQRLFQPGWTMLEMMGPWFQLPLQNRINYNFYYRKPIEQFGGQQGDFLRQSWNRKNIEVMRAIRLLSEIDRLWGVRKDSPRYAFQPSVIDRFMQSFIGLRTFDVDMSRQRSIALGQKKRIIRELRQHIHRARRRGDKKSERILRQALANEMAREPNTILPLTITGLPAVPR